jgi:hypothetical protein
VPLSQIALAWVLGNRDQYRARWRRTPAEVDGTTRAPSSI